LREKSDEKILIDGKPLEITVKDLHQMAFLLPAIITPPVLLLYN